MSGGHTTAGFARSTQEQMEITHPKGRVVLEHKLDPVWMPKSQKEKELLAAERDIGV